MQNLIQNEQHTPCQAKHLAGGRPALWVERVIGRPCMEIPWKTKKQLGKIKATRQMQEQATAI